MVRRTFALQSKLWQINDVDFLLSDAFTFSSLLIGYGAVRFSYPVPPPLLEKLAPMSDLTQKYGHNFVEKNAGNWCFR